MKESEFRKKIIWLNLICCVTVIYNHAINTDLFFPEKNCPYWLYLLENWRIPWLIRFNVPCFIMISGYLFFRNYSPKLLTKKWKRRIESLLIPYILWNALYYFGYLIGSQFPKIASILNRKPMTFHFIYFLRATLYYTHNPVFWFLFQVIILVLLAPMIEWIFRRKIMAAAYFLTLLVLAHNKISLGFLNLDALFYYSAAAYAALHGKNWIEKNWTEITAWHSLALLEVGYGLSWLYYQSYWIPGIMLFHVLTITAMWQLIPANYLPEPKNWMKGTFFIYALHFIPTRLINKLAAEQFPESTTAALIFYLLMPVFIISLCTLISSLMKKYLPSFYRLLSGNR